MADAIQFDEIGNAADAVREHIIIHKNDFPAHVRDRFVALTRTGTSPVDMIVNFTKAVYANREEFDEETKCLAVGTADLINMKGFYGRLDDTAGAISNALSRDAGLDAPAGKPWPAAEQDPPVDPEWTPPEPEPEAEEGDEEPPAEPVE